MTGKRHVTLESRSHFVSRPGGAKMVRLPVLRRPELRPLASQNEKTSERSWLVQIYLARNQRGGIFPLSSAHVKPVQSCTIKEI